jgi:hypothetical protein
MAWPQPTWLLASLRQESSLAQKLGLKSGRGLIVQNCKGGPNAANRIDKLHYSCLLSILESA